MRTAALFWFDEGVNAFIALTDQFSIVTLQRAHKAVTDCDVGCRVQMNSEMSKLRSVPAGALLTAMLAPSFTPDLAQGYRGGYIGGGYGRSDYRHRGDDDIVAGVIGVGILAAIVSLASSSANRAPSLGYAGNGYSGNIGSDAAAADGCANAAK